MSRPHVALAALLLLVAVAPIARAAGTVDQGSFKLYRHDRALGAETFELSEGNDSLVVRARQYLALPGRDGDEPLERRADLLVSRSDYSLRQYQSNRTLHGTTNVRAVVVADTHYVAYRESGDAGEGISYVLPPGRLYVMEAQLVTLFDLIGRSLHGKSFETRSINLLALGPRDTMLAARAVSRGTETIRWGARPVVARKLEIVADSQTTFTLWLGPRGQLLRLSEPMGGLRAERDPPPVRRRAKPEPKPGG